MKYKWIEIAKRIQALAQSGLHYSKNEYDIERYEELRNISIEIMSDFTQTDMEKVRNLFANEKGYQTPKVDVRAVVFRDNKILMVKEKIDNCWSLPGGWADVCYTPSEVAVKETREEAGLEVKPIRLLGVLDKKEHPHPPCPYHIYKIFILCKIVGGKTMPGIETSDVQFFDRNNLPQLSVTRNTKSQINTLFEFLDNPKKQVIFD